MMLRIFSALRHYCAGVALLLALGVAAPALAQQNAMPPVLPSHLDVATEVLKASGLGTMFNNALPNVVGQLRVNFTRARPELTKDIEEVLKAIEAKVPESQNDGMKNVGRFLAAKMSEDELKEVLTFMTSPAGKKYVTVLPAFMEEVVPFLEQWNQVVTQGMQRMFQEEMAKRGHKL